MMQCSARDDSDWFNKVPEVTSSFWIIKILSTTVGETGADFLAVNLGWGQRLTDSLTGALLAVALFAQLLARRHVPWLYWLSIVLVSVVGTQITDLLTDGFDVSLYVSTCAFGAALVLIFALWYAVERTLSIRHIVTRRRELFYWTAVLCTFALGTAAGDLATEAWGVGFKWGVLIFGSLIGLTFLLWRLGASTVTAFWVAYVLTRPFGAALGDLLTQAKTYGGLGVGTARTSVLFGCAILMLVCAAQFGASAHRPPPAAR
ncbi:MAG: hypothetical protein QM756_46160 [Polyangiaceae bacterium]